MDKNKGHQCIGCEVTSCDHNKRGCECDLDSITIRPSCNCHSGSADESMCASYQAK
ncbi:MAG: DUF1540 domain-containing protein [Eubacteriales bacterium]|nr:DUF1540 domain-containing protein [Eubacteriales bacterium]